jgi:nucleoid-associated protein YgaU
MNLKEAQLLGILALIAVGIILLCMWGGGDDLPGQSVASDGIEMEGDLSFAPSIAEIFDHLQRESVELPVTFEPVEPEATVVVGTPPAGAESGLDEEGTIWDLMKERMPRDIPLTPKKEEPPKEEPKPTRPRARSPIVHVVEKGETLSSISKKHYDTVAKWRIIYEANKSVIPDPNVVPVGTKLRIPAATEAGRAEVAAAAATRVALSADVPASRRGRRTYTAKKGDTLFRIALKEYDDGSKWKDILAANRDQLKADRDLKENMVIVIP